MTDIELAKANLDGHSICLCRDGEIITDGSRGISPMMKFIAEDKDLKGYSVAVLIIVKATAMLFVKVVSPVFTEKPCWKAEEYTLKRMAFRIVMIL